MVNVPFLDLKAQYANIGEKINQAVIDVLKSQHFILGPAVEKLEKFCAEHCGCRYALGVSSGTDALLMALMAFGVGPGDEVITTDFSFFATASVIRRLQAKPVFVDIDEKTFNLNVERIEAAITPKTRAIMPVHLYGQCADMRTILDIARKRGIAVVEDAAQAFGATYLGKAAGNWGDIGCFSFYPTKNLGGIGEGGLVTVNDDKLHRKLLDLRNQGSVQRGPYELVGGNFRLDAVQAAALSVKGECIREWNKKRAVHAATYRKAMHEAGLENKVVLPYHDANGFHIYHQFVIKAEKRDALQEFLKQKGVGSAVYYNRSLHSEPCFAEFGYRAEDFPQTESAARTVLALPIYPELTEEQILYVVQVIQEFYR